MLDEEWVVFIEARMGSSRLPRKVIRELGGLTAIELLIKRLEPVIPREQVYVATTDCEPDDALCSYLTNLGVQFLRGSEEDVMGRIIDASRMVDRPRIVSLTGDCPLIDYRIIASMAAQFEIRTLDYMCNFLPPSFPDGMEVQIFSLEAISKVLKISRTAQEQEHTGLVFRNYPEIFSCFNFEAPNNLRAPGLGLTLDEETDALLISAIVEFFSPRIDFSCEEILQLLEERPYLKEINKNVERRRS